MAGAVRTRSCHVGICRRRLAGWDGDHGNGCSAAAVPPRCCPPPPPQVHAVCPGKKAGDKCPTAVHDFEVGVLRLLCQPPVSSKAVKHCGWEGKHVPRCCACTLRQDELLQCRHGGGCKAVHARHTKAEGAAPEGRGWGWGHACKRALSDGRCSPAAPPLCLQGDQTYSEKRGHNFTLNGGRSHEFGCSIARLPTAAAAAAAAAAAVAAAADLAVMVGRQRLVIPSSRPCCCSHV